MDKQPIIEILQKTGANYRDCGDYIQCNAVWRSGDNPNAITIYHKTDRFSDWPTSTTGNLTKLFSLLLDIPENKVHEVIKTNDINNISYISEKEDNEIFIDEYKIFDNSYLSSLELNHTYWLNRGISESVISKFKGGVCKEGRLKNRYVFPIFNSKNQIVGFSGRSLDKEPKIKWKHWGNKSEWCYPLFLNAPEIKKNKEVVLVEGIGDCLALAEAGINNSISIFGCDMGLNLLNYLLRISVKKIIISLNSDIPGQTACEKLQRRLYKYFDKNVIKINIPNGQKDWGEILKNDGKQEILEQFHK